MPDCGTGQEPIERRRASQRRRYWLHIERRRAKALQRRQQRRANGICCRCNQPVEPGRSRCSAHLQQNADRQVQTRNAGMRTRLTARNPNRTECIINRLKTYEPYLQRDWDTAEPWIREHIELWKPHEDNALIRSFELKELTHMFNVYLDGCVNYLENGMRLGGYV